MKKFKKTQKKQSFNHRILEKRGEEGFSLIEIIIVVALIGGLMTFILPGLQKGQEQVQINQTEMMIGKAIQSVLMFETRCKRVPTTEEGLQVLIEPGSNTKCWRVSSMDEEQITDPWGNLLDYKKIGKRKYEVYSYGPDGEEGTEDDISSLEEEE